MTDHVKAFIRTMMPMVFGLSVGVGAYFIFSYLPPMLLALVMVVGVGIYLFLTLFDSNLEAVRREKNKTES